MTEKKLYDPKGPKVSVWGNCRCLACLALRNKLDKEGWRFRYYEVNLNTKHRLDWLKKHVPGWDGTLPVMSLNGIWQFGGSWVDYFEPWPIEQPKRVSLAVRLALVPDSEWN